LRHRSIVTIAGATALALAAFAVPAPAQAQTPDGVVPRSTNSTSIGYNMELYRASGGGTTIGVVLLNASSSAYPGDSAIRILGRWNQGIYFPATAGAQKAAEGVAIDIEAP